MAIKLFSPGADFDIDPGKANRRLQKWIDALLLLYQGSPEYQKLSKANRKNGGEWFRLFMDLYLNYIGGRLVDLDEEDAEEVMCDLMPRKLVCADRQVKTIVPELIAVWRFLKRALAEQKPARRLPHADAVIAFLESIRKDYLAIYRGEYDEGGDDFGGLEEADVLGLLESLLQPRHSPGQLIADAAKQLPSLLDSPRPPMEWLALTDPPGCEAFLEYLCLEGVNEQLPGAVEAAGMMLAMVLQSLFMRIRQGESPLKAFWQTMEHRLMEAHSQGRLKPGGVNLLLEALQDYRQYLSPEFMAFIHAWHSEMAEAKGGEQAFEVADLHQDFLSVLAEVPDEFAMVTGVQGQLGFLPPDAFGALVGMLLELGNADLADALALMVLDETPGTARAVVQQLLRVPGRITPKALGRLVRTRNWLAEPVRNDVDGLIRAVRKTGVVPAIPESVPDTCFRQVLMSGVDGSGAQGAIIILAYQDQFRLLSLVFKERVGVVDVMVSPPDTMARMNHCIKLAKQEAGALEKVSPDLIRTLLPAFLALNLESRTAIDHELVQILELLGVTDWNPMPARVQALAGLDRQAAPDQATIEAVQKRSRQWCGSAVGQSWFEHGEAVARAIANQRTVADKQLAVCRDVLEPLRAQWQERMARMTLWAAHSENARRRRQAQDYAVVSWLLGQVEPVENIEMMREVARRSLDW